jgi:hypothetical protein
MRRFVGATTALLAAVFSIRCGGREGTLRTAPVPAGSASGTSSSAQRGGDALCGNGWRWDGTRCMQLDPSSGDSKDGRTKVAGGSSGGNRTEGSGASEGGGNGGSGSSGGGGGSADEPSRASSLQSGGASTAQLVVRDVTVGTGAEAKAGDNVRIHYVGTLADGTEFDSSRKRGVPFEFRLGTNQVIKGFDRGILGMKVGGVRQLTIPPELGYGRKGAPPLIPPRATLVFEIELLDVT